MGADLRHRHTIGEGADLRQDHPLTSSHGSLQAVGILRFDANHLHLGAQVLHIGGNAGDQPAAAHRHEDGIQHTRALAEDLHGHGALPGNHIRVVERRYEGGAVTVGQLQRVRQGMGEALTVQHHMPAARTYPFHFQRRRGGGHDDGGLHAQVRCRQGHALGMVARRCSDYPARSLHTAQA
ncbi:hypothetical protein D9M71_293090 [compost metagenome]